MDAHSVGRPPVKLSLYEAPFATWKACAVRLVLSRLEGDLVPVCRFGEPPWRLARKAPFNRINTGGTQSCQGSALLVTQGQGSCVLESGPGWSPGTLEGLTGPQGALPTFQDWPGIPKAILEMETRRYNNGILQERLDDAQERLSTRVGNLSPRACVSLAEGPPSCEPL